MRILGKGKKKRAGFTLIELMVVVIVVGILAAAAVPIYRFAMSRAYSSEAKATMGTMMSSMKVFYTENEGSYPTSVFGTSNDATSVLTTLGVDTITNTWWHAPPDTTGTTCAFGTVDGVSLPDVTGVTSWNIDPSGGTGPLVFAAGTSDPITDIQIAYDMGTDTWYTAF